MKISIWQQFGSNHSNSFTVVGKFDTTADAYKAYLEFHKIIREIADWYRLAENKAFAQTVFEVKESRPPSPIEVEVFGRYDIHVERLTTWLAQVPHWGTIDENTQFPFLRQFHQYIVFESSETIWSGAHPFDLLMKQLGRQVHVREEANKTPAIMAHITALASDEDNAFRIFGLVVDYKKLSVPVKKRTLAPWYAYLGGTYDPDTLPERLEELRIWKDWKPSNFFLPLDLIKRLTDEEKQEAQEERDRYARLDRTRYIMRHSIPIDPIEVKDKTLVFTIGNGKFDLAHNTFVIISWLRGEGCEVSIRFAPEEPRSNKK